MHVDMTVDAARVGGVRHLLTKVRMDLAEPPCAACGSYSRGGWEASGEVQDRMLRMAARKGVVSGS